MNWFEYKRGREFNFENFNDKEGGKWPEPLQSEIPLRPFKKMFCNHKGSKRRIPTIYFRPDHGGGLPSVAADRLIEEQYEVVICTRCGETLNRRQTVEGKSSPTFS